MIVSLSIDLVQEPWDCQPRESGGKGGATPPSRRLSLADKNGSTMAQLLKCPVCHCQGDPLVDFRMYDDKCSCPNCKKTFNLKSDDDEGKDK